MTDAHGTGTEDLDSPRAEGPSVVWEGKSGARAILVLDPAGAAKHDEVPASWRDIAAARQIVWCRLPADGSLSDAADLLADPSALGAAVDVVTSAPATETVLDLVSRHPETVRAVLLVDPAAHGVALEEAKAINEQWEQQTRATRAELGQAGVRVEVVAHSTVRDDDRVEPPLPLGHPDVVAGLRSALAQLDG